MKGAQTQAPQNSVGASELAHVALHHGVPLTPFQTLTGGTDPHGGPLRKTPPSCQTTSAGWCGCGDGLLAPERQDSRDNCGPIFWSCSNRPPSLQRPPHMSHVTHGACAVHACSLRSDPQPPWPPRERFGRCVSRRLSAFFQRFSASHAGSAPGQHSRDLPAHEIDHPLCHHLPRPARAPGAADTRLEQRRGR